MSSFDKTTPCLGFIYGNRDFFPDQLVTEARADLARLCEQAGIRAIQLGEQDSKLGGVETHADARKCAELFKRHADEIDGILVVLPNFGDEKGVADTLKLSGLNVPVLIQGLSGRSQAAQPGAPPRRLLRQDLRLQQPGSGRHQVHAHHQACLPSRPRTASPPTCKASSASAAW